jgi:hypothetical protein
MFAKRCEKAKSQAKLFTIIQLRRRRNMIMKNRYVEKLDDCNDTRLLVSLKKTQCAMFNWYWEHHITYLTLEYALCAYALPEQIMYSRPYPTIITFESDLYCLSGAYSTLELPSELLYLPLPNSSPPPNPSPVDQGNLPVISLHRGTPLGS